MSPKKTRPTPIPLDRAHDDRRKADEGPPVGWRERRHTVERRMPQVEEDAISQGEWEVYFAAYSATLQKEEDTDSAGDNTPEMTVAESKKASR